MNDHDPLDLVDLDDTQVELVPIAVHLLIQAVCVTLFIAGAMVAVILFATWVPA